MLRFFIILMPVAYILTALAYMFLIDPDPAGHCSVGDLFSDPHPVVPALGANAQTQSMILPGVGPPAHPARPEPAASAASADIRAEALAMKVRPPVKLSWCHFIPLYRFTMVIRSPDQNDVEGVFRVNSLSSFTLGTAQMLGMAFTFMNFHGDWSDLHMFVYLNMFSQLVNWSITLLFYATSVARTMGNQISVEALTSNLSASVQDQTLIFAHLAQLKAKQVARDQVDDTQIFEVDKLVKKFEWEVMNMKNLKIQLDNFLPEEIDSVRRTLYQQWAEEYARC